MVPPLPFVHCRLRPSLVRHGRSWCRHVVQRAAVGGARKLRLARAPPNRRPQLGSLKHSIKGCLLAAPAANTHGRSPARAPHRPPGELNPRADHREQNTSTLSPPPTAACQPRPRRPPTTQYGIPPLPRRASVPPAQGNPSNAQRPKHHATQRNAHAPVHLLLRAALAPLARRRTTMAPLPRSSFLTTETCTC